MKIDGRSLAGLATGKVKLPRPDGFIELKVQAMALGDEDKGSRLFPDVRPPSDFIYDRKGGIVRDPFTNKPLREANTFDPAYAKASEHASRMQIIVQAVDAIECDPTVTWDTESPKGSREFYCDVADELKTAGFTFGDLRLIIAEARALGNLDAKRLEEAAESFSSAEE